MLMQRELGGANREEKQIHFLFLSLLLLHYGPPPRLLLSVVHPWGCFFPTYWLPGVPFYYYYDFPA